MRLYRTQPGLSRGPDHPGRPRNDGASGSPELHACRGELILFEVLAGLRDQEAVARLRPMFDAYGLVSMLDFELVPRAVANCQALRRRGIAGGTVDMIIGTFCIKMVQSG